MLDKLDPRRYTVVDNETGEVLDMAVFISAASKNGWERAYAKVIAEYINCAGDKSSQLLAYLIRARNVENMVHGTLSEISLKAGVSLSVTNRVMKTLIKKGMTKKIRSGAYMITPKMIRNGKESAGAMLIRTWNEA